MNRAIVAILIFVCSAFAMASEVSYIDSFVPFSCENASVSNAKIILASRCEEMGQLLSDVRMSSCQPVGDDGGYVNYFEVTFLGTCLKLN